MKRGIIGLVEGDFNELTDSRSSIEKGPYELDRGIDIIREINANGIMAYYGQAGIEELEESQKVDIGKDSIEVSEKNDPVTRYTEFLAVPGELVIISNSGGAFAFDLIGQQTNTLIQRSNIDLQGFYSDIGQEASNVWKLGFEGLSGGADNGVVYGNTVTDDSEIGGIIERLDKNQLGIEYEKNGEGLRLNLTESGYVEVYQPENYESEDFIEFVLSELRHHLSIE